VLRQALEFYGVYQNTIRRCDAEIEGTLRDLQADRQAPDALPAASRRASRNANEPDFDVRSPLFALCGGVDREEASVMRMRSGSPQPLIGRSLARPHTELSTSRLCPSPEPGDNGSSRSHVMRTPARANG